MDRIENIVAVPARFSLMLMEDKENDDGAEPDRDHFIYSVPSISGHMSLLAVPGKPRTKKA